MAKLIRKCCFCTFSKSHRNYSFFVYSVFINYNESIFYEHHVFSPSILLFERKRILFLISDENIYWIYDEFLSDYTQAIRLNPNYADAYYDRGLLHYFEKRYTEAFADFSSALRIDYDSMPAEVDYAIEDMGGWPEGGN